MNESRETSRWDDDPDDQDYDIRKSNRERGKETGRRRPKLANPEREHRRTLRAGEEREFRCRHCRAMVGPTISGGRHRNHCPNCLYSLHVDGKTPGDRASECRSLMKPVGLFARPSGEQVIVHRCLGCGFERFNRVAADDSPLLVMELELVDPPSLDQRSDEEDDSVTE